ncbi:MAG: antibiotic biosynthesis monooxygenase [Candidatus Glassbacteria bacterium]|nr:antibiotic biosynthesis monooxygenase [Candidatus Glassbacteria bacterium]
MAQDKVTVVAVIKAKSGREDQVRRELEALIAPTREEEGCINYDMHRGSEDPSLFMFHENWRSKGDLDIHLQQPYLARFMELADDLLAEPVRITLWEEISSR